MESSRNYKFFLAFFCGILLISPNWSISSPHYNDVFSKDPLNAKKVKEMAAKGIFSDNFLFGAATSAFQAEGAWNVSDKGMSIWDHAILENPTIISDGSDATVSTDFYHKYKTDIGLIKQLGANTFRISMSWSRILPNGLTDYISNDGIAFYNNVIDEMIRENIIPMITIFHWDLPQKLQDLGGWTNSSISDWFVDYARILFREFGDRVKIWITINEPFSICYLGYNGIFPPFEKQSGIGDYLCVHDVLLTHAKVYRMYHNEFAAQKGKIGMSPNLVWPEAKNPQDKEEIEGVERFYIFLNDWILHPIFSTTGDYPKIMKDSILEKSLAQNFTDSRLPRFTQEEIDLVKGSSNFLAFNFYSISTVYKYVTDEVSYLGDIGMNQDWVGCHPDITPKALSSLIKRINSDYNNPIIIITENGYPDSQGQLEDLKRAEYFHQHLSELLPLIASGINIRGYIAWSLVDVFEWMGGYSCSLGIYSIDFDDPNRPRTPRKSACIIRDVYKSKRIPDLMESFNSTFLG